MKKAYSLLCLLMFTSFISLMAQKPKRQWEIGAGLDIYRCELNGVSHEKTGNKLLMGTPFTQDRYQVPLSYALYVRSSILRSLPQLKLQVGFGIWQHRSVIHFDGMDIAAGPNWPVYTKADLNFRITYWQIPIALQYKYALSKKSSLLLQAGATLGIRKEVYDNYNDIHNSLLSIGSEVVHNSEKLIQAQIGIGYQYQHKRHSISINPYIRLGSYRAMQKNDYHYPAFYHNLRNAVWRTPYGISLQYFYSFRQN